MHLSDPIKMWDAAVSICWIVCSEAEGGLSCGQRMLCALAFRISRWDELQWVLARINHPRGGLRLSPGDSQVLGTERTLPERGGGQAPGKGWELNVSSNSFPPPEAPPESTMHPLPAFLGRAQPSLTKNTPSRSARWGRTDSWGNAKG